MTDLYEFDDAETCDLKRKNCGCDESYMTDALMFGEEAAVLNKYISYTGLMTDTIEAYHAWVYGGLQNQINAKPIMYNDKEHGQVDMRFEIKGAFRPVYSYQGKEVPLYGYEAKVSGKTLLAKIITEPVLYKSGTNIPHYYSGMSVDLFSIPAMKRSRLDPAFNIIEKGPEYLARIGETQDDPGSYYIYNGNMCFIPHIEKLRVNQVFVSAPTKKFSYYHVRQTVNVPSGTAIIKVFYTNDSICVINTMMMSKPVSTTRKPKKTDSDKYNYMNVLHMIEMINLLYRNDENTNVSSRSAVINYALDFMRQLIRNENYAKFLDQFSSTIDHYYSVPIGNAVKKLTDGMGLTNKSPLERTNKILDLIVKDIFPYAMTPKSKIQMVCVLTVRLMGYLSGAKGYNLTNIDDWSHKRLDTSSVSFSQIFRKVYSRKIDDINEDIAKSGVASYDISSIVGRINERDITINLLAPFKEKRKPDRGVYREFELSEILDPTNVIDMYQSLNKVKVKVAKESKSKEVRSVQPSQLDYVCTVTTPDDSKCGINKNKAGTSKITLESSIDTDMLKNAGILIEDSTNDYNVGVMCNGLFTGWCNGKDAYEKLTLMRRTSPAKFKTHTTNVNGDVIIDVEAIEGGVHNAVLDLLNSLKDRSSEKTDRTPNLIRFDNISFYTSEECTNLLDFREAYTVNNVLDRNACITLTDYDMLEIYTDAGRLVRPVLAVENEEILIDKYKCRDIDFGTIIRMGFVDFIDPFEEGSQSVIVKPNKDSFKDALKDRDRLEHEISILEEKVARMIESQRDDNTNFNDYESNSLRDEDIESNQHILTSYKLKYENIKAQTIRYVGLHSNSKYGIGASLTPFSSHMPSCRLTFQAKMISQSLTLMIYGYEHKNGIFSLYPTYPLVTTAPMKAYGLMRNPQSLAVSAAVLTDRYNQEDALIMSSSMKERFRYIKRIDKDTEVDRTGGKFGEELGRFPNMRADDRHKFRFIQSNGFPMIGAHLEEGDYVIGKFKRRPDGSIKDESVVMRRGEFGVVKDIIIRPASSTYKNSTRTSTIIRVLVEAVVSPEVGDKYASEAAQKTTLGLIRYVADMPTCIKTGSTPDIIYNPHCFTADTPVLMKNGLSKRLVDTCIDGGDKVWSFDKNERRFVTSKTNGYISRGDREIVKVTLSDGRVIRCTPDHKFPVIKYENTPFGIMEIMDELPISQVTNDMYVMATIDGPLDYPTDEQKLVERAWTLNMERHFLSMDTDESRNIALAFARILGLVLSDGCLVYHTNRKNGRTYIAGNICIGSSIDLDIILDDIELITGKRPKSSDNTTEKGGSTYRVNIPYPLASSMASLDGVTVGRRSNQKQEWPTFLSQSDCPLSVIREFLGGLLGGDGGVPYLRDNKTEKGFRGPYIGQSAEMDRKDELIAKMTVLADLLIKVGVDDAKVGEWQSYDCGTMVTCSVYMQNNTNFGSKVGFRYCIDKSYKLAAYQSNLMFMNSVKEQGRRCIARASQIHDNNIGLTLEASLRLAGEEMFPYEEIPFNNHYSYGTMYQLGKYRSAAGYNPKRDIWRYEYIDTSGQYMERIGAYDWFRSDTVSGRADYIVKREDTSTPYFKLKVHDVRFDGITEVFDLEVDKTHTLVVNGIAANNCLTGRLTVNMPLEILIGKAAAIEGYRYDGTNFNNLREEDADERNRRVEEVLLRNGYTLEGNDTYINGETGKMMDVRIFTGNLNMQELYHKAHNKVQGRARGAKDARTGQGLRGRLALHGSSMKFDAMTSDCAAAHGASEFLAERMRILSDNLEIIYCTNCEKSMTMIEESCTYCAMHGTFVRTDIATTFKYTTQLLAGMNIKMNLAVKTEGQYIRDLRTQIDMEKNRQYTNKSIATGDIYGGSEEQVSEDDSIDVDFDAGDTIDFNNNDDDEGEDLYFR